MIAQNLEIRKILATNSQETIEIELEFKKGNVKASVPIGTSVGKYEAKYLPVDQVLKKFSLIKKHFINEDFKNQEDVDLLLRSIDTTPDLREIGANLALGISSAFLKAFALNEGLEVFEYLSKGKPSIPKPICNIVGGWKDSKADIQEYLLLPEHQKSFADSIINIAKAYRQTGKMLIEKDESFAFSKNLESAWVTSLKPEEILKILEEVAQDSLAIGLDVAASQLWDGEKYFYSKFDLKLTRTEQIAFMEKLARSFPIVYIEDPFHEDDFIGFSTLTHRLRGRIVCGDDLYASNLARFKEGVLHKATNGIIIKPNQVGTITDVIKLAEEAKKEKHVRVISHRSGETEDTLICHLAVGLGCEYIKLGISGERTVKINEMIRIEEKI
ncbi:MAG: enolase C-terminal domain-like protein [Candidatus Aenigmatarchaeota archaeon]